MGCGAEEATTGEAALAMLLWGMFYVDDAGLVSQLPEKLRKMMAVIVVVCAVFDLAVSEAKTELCVYAPRGCRSPPPYLA